MKKLWWVILAVSLGFGLGKVAPFEPMDAGEMCILETLFVEQGAGNVRLIGKDVEGSGESVEEAYKKMEATAPGKLYLKQVKRVIYCGSDQGMSRFQDLPEDIPLGASIYQTEATADKLMEGLDKLEKRLQVWEREKETVPTLAELLDWELGKEK